ncbi:MAG: LLM class flavin-dependent oxidoreductase [Myxococcales bacterium]
MTLEILWRLPTQGDGRAIDSEHWQRGDYSRTRREPHPFARTGAPRDGYNYYDLLLQIARGAELNGFDGLWIPDSAGGEDPLIVAGSLAREARNLRFVTSLRAPLLSAVYATKIANSFQRLSGNRLAWHLNTRADHESQPWHGRKFSESEYVARSAEFLDVAKGFWNAAPFSYAGKYYEVENGGFAPALQGQTLPRVYLSGTSEEALALSARHADVHVFPLASVHEIRALSQRLQQLASEHGRRVAVGIDGNVLARHSSEEAWAEAERAWEGRNAKTIAIAEGVTGIPTSFAQTKVGKPLWSGFGALQSGATNGLVGSFSEVATAIDDYLALGVRSLVLGANPYIEEAYRLGEHLVPVIHRRHAATKLAG